MTWRKPSYLNFCSVFSANKFYYPVCTRAFNRTEGLTLRQVSNLCLFNISVDLIRRIYCMMRSIKSFSSVANPYKFHKLLGKFKKMDNVPNYPNSAKVPSYLKPQYYLTASKPNFLQSTWECAFSILQKI